MKILFVDNERESYERFKELPFAKQHEGEIEFLDDPVGLPEVVKEHKAELRLIILDMLWDQNASNEGITMGASAMRQLALHTPYVPVVIYSIITDVRLQHLYQEAMRIGAYDWISKDEPKMLRSLRFQRAYDQGQDRSKKPSDQSVLAREQSSRSKVHVAVMFVDMSGFTALTHNCDAQAMVETLRHFYPLVVDPIQANGGYVDKYIGDAVMAVFGALGESMGDDLPHVHKCIQAARLIQAKSKAFKLEYVDPVLNRYNGKLTDEQCNKIGLCRIGIESGMVEIARFQRGNESDVTFIGTPVNIAARILAQGDIGEVWIGQNAHRAGALASQTGPSESVEYKNLPGPYLKYQVNI